MFILLQTDERAYHKLGVAMDYLPNSWNFVETFKIFRYKGAFKSVCSFVACFQVSHNVLCCWELF